MEQVYRVGWRGHGWEGKKEREGVSTCDGEGERGGTFYELGAASRRGEREGVRGV